MPDAVGDRIVTLCPQVFAVLYKAWVKGEFRRYYLLCFAFSYPHGNIFLEGWNRLSEEKGMKNLCDVGKPRGVHGSRTTEATSPGAAREVGGLEVRWEVCKLGPSSCLAGVATASLGAEGTPRVFKTFQS